LTIIGREQPNGAVMKFRMIFAAVALVFAITLVSAWLGLIGTPVAATVYLMLIASAGAASMLLPVRRMARP